MSSDFGADIFDEEPQNKASSAGEQSANSESPSPANTSADNTSAENTAAEGSGQASDGSTDAAAADSATSTGDDAASEGTKKKATSKKKAAKKKTATKKKAAKKTATKKKTTKKSATRKVRSSVRAEAEEADAPAEASTEAELDSAVDVPAAAELDAVDNESAAAPSDEADASPDSPEAVEPLLNPFAADAPQVDPVSLPGEEPETEETAAAAATDAGDDSESKPRRRRRRRRGGDDDAPAAEHAEAAPAEVDGADADPDTEVSAETDAATDAGSEAGDGDSEDRDDRSRRRRRRRRRRDEEDGAEATRDAEDAPVPAASRPSRVRSPHRFPPTPGAERHGQRVAILLDVDHLQRRAADRDAEIAFGRLLEQLGRRRHVIRAIAYGDADKHAALLRGNGFEYRGFAESADPLDRPLAMSIDALALASRVDCIVLIPGDARLTPLIQRLDEGGVRVELADFSADEGNGEPELGAHATIGLEEACSFTP